MGRRRTGPRSNGVPPKRYSLCKALVDLLEEARLSNADIVRAVAERGEKLPAQTLSRQLLGQNEPSPRVIQTIITAGAATLKPGQKQDDRYI